MVCPHGSCRRRFAARSLLAHHLAYDHGYANAEYLWAVYPWTPTVDYPAPKMPAEYRGNDG